MPAAHTATSDKGQFRRSDETSGTSALRMIAAECCTAWFGAPGDFSIAIRELAQKSVDGRREFVAGLAGCNGKQRELAFAYVPAMP
jgi:hypothetical protein